MLLSRLLLIIPLVYPLKLNLILLVCLLISIPMLDDFNYDLFGDPVYPSLDDCVKQLKYDFDLVQISKTKLTSTVRKSLSEDFYRSDVICHELFPKLHSLEVQSFNNLANSRFI